MSESGEKTEPPTPKKIRDARKKGQVANSKDLTSTVLLVGMFSCMAILWKGILKDLKEVIYLAFYYIPNPREGLAEVVQGVFLKYVGISLPFIGVVFVLGIAANYIQVGPLLALESIKPDLKKLNPVDKLKQIFGVKNIVEFLKSSLKVVFLGTIVYFVIKGSIDPLLKIPYIGVRGVMELLPAVLQRFAIHVVLGYTAFSAFDFFFQKHQHFEQLKMTKDEVKREYKEMEGDPLIKSKRRQLHQELLTENTMETVKKSTAMVTNPTHFAVTLLYDEKKVPLPIVNAKGKGALAKRMIKTAKEAKVPIMENVWLARSLYDDVPENNYVPREYIPAVAEVLKWVKKQKEGGP